ncbi:uncharacterized protein LOC114575159 [Exaiptasia diaphana]|uniref:Uncharacterized protein n=1 Tax=Exaiptasia diaphana TaxID=2652724 RepID=A0A913YJF9_EXADI|nr:uncharacterized protein LOC114575159 [Exaiptasia diaphana]
MSNKSIQTASVMKFEMASQTEYDETLENIIRDYNKMTKKEKEPVRSHNVSFKKKSVVLKSRQATVQTQTPKMVNKKVQTEPEETFVSTPLLTFQHFQFPILFRYVKGRSRLHTAS